jgi:phage recombination protein Bet
MTEEKAIAKREKREVVPQAQGRSVLASMAARYCVNSEKLLDTLKNTAFKGATNEQLMALCIVADQYKLNPFTKEIYAFPDKGGGIVPVVGIDGWLRIINDHPAYDGMEIEGDDVECTVTIHRKDRTHVTKATEYASECKRETAPWKSHPARMLRHKAIIQAARIAFGFSLKDPDEAERIIEAQAAETRPPIAPPRVIEVAPEPDKPTGPALELKPE